MEKLKRRGKTIALTDRLWTTRHVALYLDCSESHALKWLRDRAVPMDDIGIGRSEYRIDPANVRAARTRDRNQPQELPQVHRPSGYVAKYRKSNQSSAPSA